MATAKLYRNGLTMGVGNPFPTGGKRGEITGWSPSAVRRHKRWLYSIDNGRLEGVGDAVTLTLRDTPGTDFEWRRLVQLLLKRIRSNELAIRWHWVVEWQRRGTPHLHLAVYGQESLGAWVTFQWLLLTEDYGSQLQAQYVTPIYGAEGWSKYLSKHAARGVQHYQRQGKPEGWQTTGRLWGKGGDWPEIEPLQADLQLDQMWRIRRLVRGFAVSEARAAALRYERAGEAKKARAAWKSVAYSRRMLSCPDRKLSTVRGVSTWVPEDVSVRLLEATKERFGIGGRASLTGPPATAGSALLTTPTAATAEAVKGDAA